MPSHPKRTPSTSQTRLDSVAAKLTVTLETLDVLVDGFKSSFLEPVCLATRSILTAVQTAKGNKNDCVDVLDGVNQLLSAVIALHITSDAGTELRPSFLQEMGRCVKTLHKVFSLLETQRETSRIKLLFRQGELSTMLKDCKTDLANILESLKLQAAGLVDAMHDLQVDMDKTRQHILELVSSLSGSDGDSLSRSFSSRSYSTSSVLSLLPSIPKIFHGREHQLTHIIEAFGTNDSPRIAILGPGGIGKTSLARAVLHHPDIVLRYRSQQEQHNQCSFVPCDTALAVQDLLTLVGSHLGLTSGRNLRREIASRLGEGGSHLLVLDNLETVWEPVDWREEVEEILAFLADIPRLAILITMRGAERPTRIHWTRPFLPALEPLTQDAARQTFLDIADESLATEGTLDAVLRLTDNLPLAITLMAHLVDSEGFDSVLTRWDEEKTALFSDGFDKRSNLDMSIAMSLSSPRLRSHPHAVDLLSLLSVLPDGLSEGDLLQQNHLPIENILECKTALLRTSLAYISSSKRLNLLVPIREYVRQHHSPRNALVQPVFRAYLEVLELSKNYYGLVPSGDLLAHIGANFANIQTLLVYNLQRVDVDGLDADSLVRCAISANMYSRAAGKGEIPFFGQLVAKGRFEQLGVGGMLEVHFLAERLSAYYYKLVSDGPALIERAIALFPTFDDPRTKCASFTASGEPLAESFQAFCTTARATGTAIGPISPKRRCIRKRLWACPLEIPACNAALSAPFP
ncbi:P-loop containing nucleoside triphosphate hydrolase protein [Mycena amicta]|nr:P-loop containing nucleoside triphosphate hydrolase protein [Mycena amicta]